MSTEIRVALVYQQDEASKPLRVALANAGVGIAIESRASDLDPAAILDSQVDAIVVNLDPELEDLLDEVAEALDNASQPVIFNDPAASSDLSGWDRARWLRHLSAKLKGRTDVTPPAPPGAQAIPTPVPKVPVAAIAAPAATAVANEPSGEPDALTAAETAEPAMELSLADLDAMFEAPEAAAPPSATPGASLTMGEDLGDLDAFFEQQVELVDLETAPSPEPPPATAPSAATTPTHTDVGDTIDLDALFSTPGQAAGEPQVAMASEDELNDLDALFSQPPPADPEDARVAPVATSSELNDLDALFREFEASKEADAAPAPVVAPATAAAPKAAPADWSLEPLDDLLAELPSAAPEVVPKSAAPAPKTSSGPSIPAELEASLALADLKLVDDSVAPEAPVTADAGALGGIADLDSLDLSGLELDTLESTSATPAADQGEELSLTDIDFDFDLGNSVGSASAATASAGDADLGDLDSLFEPVAATAVATLSLPDLNRIFVLGASIGGPEAVKAFLGRLPGNVPAAFIVAQHMGSEFLEMMAAQLDTATALSVRYPKAGERLRHGEVIVAPANEHLTLDAEGRVQLSAAPSGSPYSPSIDQLARDAADRFGDHATLILFSGMGTDAVEGGRYLSARGGQVWAQDRASCVIATMIDSAKSEGLLRFEGSPVQLAERVLELVS